MTCTWAGCDGVVADGHVCLAHVNEEHLGRLLQPGAIDLRGSLVPAGRMEAIVALLPEDRGKKVVTGAACFDDATFEARCEIEDVDFQRGLSLRGTRFCSDAILVHCDFDQQVDMSEATFERDAELVECNFSGGGVLTATTFKGSVRMDSWFSDLFSEDAVFEGYCRFLRLMTGNEANGVGRAVFYGARFDGRVTFAMARVAGELCFQHATFNDAVEFNQLKAYELNCDGTRFKRGGDLGSFWVEDFANFTGAEFDGAVRMRLRAATVDLRRSVFTGGATILVEQAFVAVAGASFLRPSTVAAAKLGVSQRDSAPAADHPAPMLGSLDGTDVGNLTVDGFDLRSTRFVGGHSLDALRLRGDYLLPTSPDRFTRKRTTIYDEHELRQRNDKRWQSQVEPRVESIPLNVPNPPAASTSASLGARDISAVYRDLRKGREDAKDASGASDFYFGEMEMRRQVEKDPLLWLYLRLSGYGTRWLRSAIAFLVLVAGSSIALASCGFSPDVSLGRSVTFALGSTVYLARPPTGHSLTGTGDAVQLVLRTVGPLLLGLTLLALRSRVKR